ncbi:MAG: vWA domain-containing protein [Candidatus Limnocylindria bacterium]
MTLDLLGPTMRFADPQVLILLALVPAVVWLRVLRGRRHGGAVLFSSLSLLPARGRSWRERLRPALFVLRILALVLLVVALARPQAVRASEIAAEGIDIAVMLDLSGSMEEGDFGGARKVDAAKAVVHDFFGGLTSDRAALVVFAGEALIMAPLTLDHGALQRVVAPLDTGRFVGGGTAIGTGLAMGLNVLRESTARSRVAILLTDGQNNSGQITPEDAANAAKLLGIRVYTIGMIREQERRGGTIPVDEANLRAIAEVTGGSYFQAFDPNALRQIYDDIAELERSRIGVRTEFAAYEDVMLPFLLAGTLLLLFEVLFGLTLFRRSP